MHKFRWLLGTVLLITAPTLWAGPIADFFNRKPNTDGPERVMELLSVLQNDNETGKRARAAEDLGRFDAQAYPEIVPALSNVLQKDSSSIVRKGAAEALGRIKPPSREAAEALDLAIANDTSAWVRFHARTARLVYHVPAQPAPPPPPAAPPARTTTSASPLISKPLPSPSSSNMPLTTRPLPLPPSGSGKAGSPTDPGKFLPDPMPLPPEAKQAKELPMEPKTDNSGPILAAPKKTEK